MAGGAGSGWTRSPWYRGVPGLLAVALVALLVLAGGAQAASPYGPLNRPGPKLRVPAAKLAASLTCSPGVAGASRAPVLLLSGTGVNTENEFSWNYEKLFDQQGIPWCASDQQGMRNANQTDIQLRGQYITYAIRTMHEMAGRKIAIAGHSQGGMAMRWSLRFWPDTRAMIEDVVGFAGTNHGSANRKDCGPSCSPANAEQGAGSPFIAALNSRTETFADISYTEVATLRDEQVTPQPGPSFLDGPGRITNVLVQDICPSDTTEHLGIGTTDPVAAALALDALDNDGPADPARISPTVCAMPFQPGVDPVTAPAEIAAAVRSIFLGNPPTGGAPSLRCYVFRDNATCRHMRSGRHLGSH